MQKQLIWDWPVRIGHWLMAAAFAVAWLTADSESWRGVHVAAGGTVFAVAAFRLLWGFAGSRHARFAAFLRQPAAVAAYLKSLARLQPEHHTGHNPAGGWAIVALLAAAIITALSGWAVYEDIGGHWLEELHEGLASTMLAVVVVHLAGVASGSLLHGENLVAAMLSGRKNGAAGEGIASARPLAAAALLAWVGATVWWLLS